jgi:PAS domain S-box-containing protein
MSAALWEQLRGLLLGRREPAARRWQGAVARTSFVPLPAAAIWRRLLELTDGVIAALLGEPFDPSQGAVLGAALGQLHYVQPEALGETLAALSGELAADLPGELLVVLQPRLGALLAALATGFSRQAREVLLAEQEAMRGALLAQREAAAEALWASEARFRAVFEGAAIGIGITDLDGRIVATNPAWAAMLGYRPEEVRGRNFGEFIHPADTAASWSLYGEMMAGRREHVALEQRQFRQDGEWEWFHVVVSLVRDAAGQPQFAVGMAEHIGERKRAEAALAQQYRAAEAARGETRAILDATAEAMVLIGPDGAIRSVNQRFDELFPLPVTGLVGRPFAEVRSAFESMFAEPSAVAALVGAVTDAERRFTRDVVQRWPERRELEVFSRPVRDGAGEWLGRLYAFRDVTREREVDRMQSEFVALVSHELRTPLTSIKGYVDLLLAGDVGELEAEQREFLAVVRHNADRLAALIGDLLDVARIEAGQLALRPTALDIARVIREVAASFRPQVARKRQRLVVRAPGGLPAVWGDSERVTQILTNLVSNAHKYTPEGGQITVVAAAAGDGIRLEVRDTGVGLSPEEQARLFTRFYRAQNRATQEAGGTGLGLAITRALVEAHGGRIAVESSPGRGATFRLTLPTAPAGGEAPPPA